MTYPPAPPPGEPGWGAPSAAVPTAQQDPTQQVPPQPPRRTARWIVACAAGLVVAVAVVVGALAATGAFDDDPQPPAASAPAATDPGQADPTPTGPTPSPSSQPPRDASTQEPEPEPTGSLDNVYTAVPDLCEQLDVSAFERLLHLGEIEQRFVEIGEGNARCSSMPIEGSFTVDAYWSETPEEAVERHATSVEIYMDGPETVEEVSGPWTSAVLGQSEPFDENSCSAILLVQDGNIDFMVRFWVIGGPRPIEQADAVDAVLDLATQVLELSRS